MQEITQEPMKSYRQSEPNRLPKLPKEQLQYKCDLEAWVEQQQQPQKILNNHLAGVDCVMFHSKDSNEILSGSHDRSIKRWDLEKQAVKSNLNGHDLGVWCMDQNNLDANILASGSSDKFVFIWDLKSNKSRKPLNMSQGYIYDLKFTDDGKQIVLVNDANQIIVFDLRANKVFEIIKTQSEINYSICTDKCNQVMAVSDFDSKVTLYDTKNYQMLTQYNYNYGYENRAYQCQMDFKSQLGSKIIVGYSDGIVRTLNYDKEQQKLKLEHEFYASTEGVTSLSMDNDVLVTSTKEGICRVWDIKNQYKFKKSLVGHTDNASCSNIVTSNQGNKLLASGSWDQKIHVYQI